MSIKRGQLSNSELSGDRRHRRTLNAVALERFGNAIQSHRIPDSVLRIMRHKGGLGAAGSHPAVFPVALAAFVEEMKASGFVADALQRHGIQGAAVAPIAG